MLLSQINTLKIVIIFNWFVCLNYLTNQALPHTQGTGTLHKAINT